LATQRRPIRHDCEAALLGIGWSMAEATNGNGHRSIGELTKAVSRDAAALVRAEVDLAKREMSAKAKQSAAGGALGGVALVLLLAALGALTAAAVAGLATAMATWLAALIVAAVLVVLAAIFGLVAVSRLKKGTPPAPTETIESAKEDVQWLKRHATPEHR
jgi:uncharacterized membrane protein YqjE